MPDLDLFHIFTYHPPTGDSQVGRYEALRDAAWVFAKVVIQNTPPGPDQQAAVRKIREAMMTSNAAIALDGRIHVEEER